MADIKIKNKSTKYDIECSIKYYQITNALVTIDRTINHGETLTFVASNTYHHYWVTFKNCYRSDGSRTAEYEYFEGAGDYNIELTPYFNVRTFTESASKGSISDSGSHYLQDYYAGGKDVLVSTATPVEGYSLVNWTSNAGSSPWSRADLWVRPDRNETFTAHFEKIKYTVNYNPGDCTMSPTTTSVTKDYNASFSLPRLSKTSETKSEPIYKVHWVDNLDKSASKTTDSVPGTTKITYSNFMWKGNDGSVYDSGGYVESLRSNVNFTATRESNSEVTRQASVGPIPVQTNVDGYINRYWYNSTDTSGEKASSSTKIDSDVTFYSVREGKVYTIRFNSWPTNIVWPENSRPVSIKKQFGTNSNEFPPVIPTRKGYEFVGWATSKDTDWRNPIYSREDPAEIRNNRKAWWNPDIIRPGTILDDYFDKTYSVNGSDVNLYTIWRPINHYIQLNWYVKSTDEVQQYKKRYTIEDVVVDVFSPSTYDTGKKVMGGDWVFFGYKTYNDDSVKQTEWVDTKGIYRNINLISGVNLPYSRPVSADDWTWSEANEGLITENIYGFWTITGKYVNVNGSWKKVTCVYVNVGGGSVWRPMNGTSNDETSFSVKIEYKDEANKTHSKWCKEVYKETDN